MTASTARRTALGAAGLAAIAAATLAWAVPAQAAPAATTAHSEQTEPKIAAAWIAAWNSSDTTLLAKLFTPHGVYTDYALGKTMTGRDQVTAWKVGTDQRIADVHVTLLNAFQSGNHIAIEATYSGHINGAPTPFAVPITTILDLQHGEITTDHDNYNLTAVLTQSGLPTNTTTAPNP
jgi:limonene-1,2-epoxide hydrolase